MRVARRRSDMPLRIGLASALMVMTVLAAACGGSADEGDAGDGGGRVGNSMADLSGRQFVSESVEEAGEPRPLVPSTEIFLTFDEGDRNVGASAGCNSFSGLYEVDAGRLVVDEMGGTEMGCDEARHAQDQWLVELLMSDPAFELAGDHLTLTAGATVVVLLDREVADPDRPLTGTTWVLDTMVKGEVASTPPTGTRASIAFDDDGTFSVETGCNTGGGRYTLEGDRVTFTSYETTLMACKDEREALEAHMLGLLEAGEVRVEVEAAHLTIDAGAIGGGFTAS